MDEAAAVTEEAVAEEGKGELSEFDDYAREDIETIEEIGRELSRMKTRFYTGHCTGEIPFRILKRYMGEQLVYVHSGDEVSL